MSLDELAEKVGPDVAKAFAPYLVQELRRIGELDGGPKVTGDWDPQTCATYVSELGDPVLIRADKFFAALEQDGEISSLQLTQLLKVKAPRDLAANLTTPLKRRARTLGLERPWLQQERYGRTVWVDRNEIPRRLVEAIEAERAKRGI
jgi:hypothetical protein